MNVGQLKQQLEGLPDSMPVGASVDAWEGSGAYSDVIVEVVQGYDLGQDGHSYGRYSGTNSQGAGTKIEFVFIRAE